MPNVANTSGPVNQRGFPNRWGSLRSPPTYVGRRVWRRSFCRKHPVFRRYCSKNGGQGAAISTNRFTSCLMKGVPAAMPFFAIWPKASPLKHTYKIVDAAHVTGTPHGSPFARKNQHHLWSFLLRFSGTRMIVRNISRRTLNLQGRCLVGTLQQSSSRPNSKTKWKREARHQSQRVCRRFAGGPSGSMLFDKLRQEQRSFYCRGLLQILAVLHVGHARLSGISFA